jgi:ribosomal protein S10
MSAMNEELMNCRARLLTVAAAQIPIDLSAFDRRYSDAVVREVRSNAQSFRYEMKHFLARIGL